MMNNQSLTSSNGDLVLDAERLRVEDLMVLRARPG